MIGLSKIGVLTLFFVFPLLADGQDDPTAFKTPPSADVIARWVHGGDPREMSWAAVFALQEKDTSFLPEFASLAEQWRPLPHRNVLDREYHPPQPLTSEERERRDAMSALLDAIIQLNGNIPAASTQNLASDFPVQAIILLYRMTPQEAEPTLLALYGETAPASWYTQRAAAALLALHPPAGFAASLLSNTTVTSHVFVSLPEDPSLGMGASSGDCGGYGRPLVKADWPAIGKYSMRECGPGRDPAPYLTIPGLKPIDAVRVVTPTLQSDSGECTGFTPLNNSVRATLIAQMLDEQPERMTIKSHVDVNIKVKNDQDYKTQLAVYVDREEATFRSVKMNLTAKQLLSPAEASDDAVLPSLLLVISDSRSSKAFPLEEMQFRSPRVKWEVEHLGVLYE